MLTNRQLLILQLLVDDYIHSAKPVGSRQLSKKPEAPFSPATIRNEMADLEEMGFLEKRHSSSGRVPSEKGYRFYVDHLLTENQLNHEDNVQLSSIFQQQVVEMEELIRKSATILSDLTNYTSILLGPDSMTQTVKRFSIVPLDLENAVAIIVMDSGQVENRVFQIPKGFTASDIEKMVNILNDRLIGTPLMQLQKKLLKETKTILERHIDQASALYTSFQEAIAITPEERLFYGGKLNMINQPEFNDIEKLKTFFDLIDRGIATTNIFEETHPGIVVKIGSENNHNAMDDYSVITANYDVDDRSHGSIAIIGPKRMDYGRVIALLNMLSVDLSRELGNLLLKGPPSKEEE